jgi:holo-ACP synthase CitX
MDVSKIHQKILASKEHTYSEKCLAISENQRPLISLALNVPGWPKTDKLLRAFFFDVLADLKKFALSYRILIQPGTERIIENDNGLVYFANFNYPQNAQEVKLLAEKFESKHELGRFIDVDICDKNGINVSSKTQKLCFYCMKHSAIECMRKGDHTFSQLRIFQSEKIRNFLHQKTRNRQTETLSELTQYSLLTEISLDPKPGLVTPTDNGSHKDMNHQTFIQSIVAISGIFTKLYTDILIDHKQYTFEDLRNLGIIAEQKMKSATSNINTHKGAIFLLLTLGYAIATLLAKKQVITDNNIKAVISSFNEIIANDPLLKIDNTNGNNARNKTQKSDFGIRDEIIKGLPSLFNAGLLPFRIQNFSPNSDIATQKYILIQSLLNIMSVNNDTNIVHRGSASKLEQLKKLSRETYKSITKNNWEPYYQLCKWTKSENLSPGGSADILIGTIFTYLCQINPNLKPYEF